MKVVARPDSKSSNITAPPPQTAPNAPTNSRDQNLHQKVLQKTTPNHPKISQFVLAPHGPKQKKCQETSELRKDWPIPPTNNTTTATSNLPIKIEPQAQEQPNPSATAPQKAE